MEAEKRKRIIIVDDDEDLLKLLVFSFEAQGFEVKGFSKGKEAIEYLLNEKNVEPVALLILDRILPDIEGIDILKKFIGKYKNKVPVLILSALSSERDVITGLKFGAIDYVSKPFSLPILIEQALTLISR